MWAVIGGSGFEKFDNVEVVENYDLQTPFGLPSSGLKKVRVDGVECLFLSRHGAHHELLPSEVNYRANIFAIKQLGAQQILSISAVGSLAEECKPGDMVVPNQYFDRTKFLRPSTFCGDGVVGHMSLAHPVCAYWTEEIRKLSEKLDFQIHFGKTYVCIEGPNFSTYAESMHYRQLGAGIIGMTNFPEFALAREAGLGYVPCSFVTDYDCWKDDVAHVTLEQVLEVMRKNNGKAFALMSQLLKLPEPSAEELGYPQQGLRAGLMTPWDAVPTDKREWLEVLRG